VDFFTSMEVSASGMAAQRTRMNVASSNLANVSTTQTAEGGPYRRKDVVVAAQDMNVKGPFAEAIRGAQVTGIVEDAGEPRLEYDPGHPDADVDGYVELPNVNVVREMVDMITASRAYEAGITAMSTAVSMAERALGIG